MKRFLAGVAAALLLVAGGLFLWQSGAESPRKIAPAPAGAGAVGPVALDPLADPPRASEKTREQKRFSRYDKDRNGSVEREEYLANRRKTYAKLDTDRDGQLSFEEWAARTTAKFATADADRSGTLTPVEFVKTRVPRKAPRSDCPPSGRDEEG